MSVLARTYDRVPFRVRRRLKNRVTLLLHRYLIQRAKLRDPTITGLTIELTDKCNLRCTYCPKSVGIGVAGRNMDFDLFRRVADEAFALQPIQAVTLVGFGEPLLYPYLEEAIGYLRAKKEQVHISITSNGTLLSAEWAERLAHSGLKQITISVNATSREQYQRINDADLYETVVGNTQAFLERANELQADLRVLVQVLQGPNGPDEIAAFRRFWEPHLGRCGEIQVQPFVNWAGQIEEGRVGLLEAVAGQRAKAKGGAYPCAHLMKTWIISQEGNALPCCMVFPEEAGDLLLGNVKEKSLRELFMEGRILELRRKNFEEGLGDVTPCATCDAYRSVPNAWLRNPLYPVLKRKWL